MYFILVFDRDGGPAHTRQYASTPAIPVKTQYKVIAGRPHIGQILPQCALRIVFVTGMAGGFWQGVLAWVGFVAGRVGEGVYTNKEQ